MNYHGVKIQKRDITFWSFKGGDVSSLDQVTVPPAMGLDAGSGQLFHRFGEWLKREGRSWEFASEEKICRWAVEFFNLTLGPRESPRRFDRMATKKECP